MSQCDLGWSLSLSNSSSVYDNLIVFHEHFKIVYPYMALCICVSGIVLNLLMITVLTRRAMITTINILLTAIAVADLAVMLSSLIFTFLDRRVRGVQDCLLLPEYATYGLSVFFIFHQHFSVVLHGASLWLTVAVAAIRFLYLSLGAKMHGRELLNNRSTILLVISVVALILIVQIPNFLSFQVNAMSIYAACPSLNVTFVHANSGTNVTDFYSVDHTVLAMKWDCLVYRVVFWTNGIAFKLLPCALMSIFIAVLVKLIKAVHKRRQQLSKNSNASGGREHTTGMLVAVLTIFLVTELPQGLLNLLMGLYGAKFQHMVYRRLGDLLDLLSLINSAANFIIYCSMSLKFRQTFRHMFFPQFMKRFWTDGPENATQKPLVNLQKSPNQKNDPENDQLITAL